VEKILLACSEEGREVGSGGGGGGGGALAKPAIFGAIFSRGNN
jgi:hypothetical protein